MRGDLGARVAGVVVIAITITLSGCQGAGSRRAAPQAGVSGSLDGDGTIAESTPPKSVTYVDRHPLLATPREYWESAGDNKIVKVGAATFVGVPVGFYREMKQIVVGMPPETR